MSTKAPGLSDTNRFSQSLQNGLALLRCFSDARPAMALAEITAAVGMSQSSTHRYATTLVALGYLEQDGRIAQMTLRERGPNTITSPGALRRELSGRQQWARISGQKCRRAACKLSRELARVLADARTAFWRRPLPIDVERVRWWHGAIFARHFPRDGGHLRNERAFFGVMGRDGRTRRSEGSPPEAVHHDLAEVCRVFSADVEQLSGSAVGTLQRARAVGALYAGILRVHPFADGNHRTAFVALSATLWSLGLPAVEFADDEDMIDHDDALIPALLSRDGEIEPFARLLVSRIERAGNPGGMSV